MCSQIKSNSSYKFSLLMSSYRSLVVGATIFFGTIVLAVLADAMSIDNTVFFVIIIMIALFGVGLLLYGIGKAILSIPITLYRLVRYRDEYEEVAEPVQVAPELSDAAKKTRFLKWEKEWIALEAKRIG